MKTKMKNKMKIEKKVSILFILLILVSSFVSANTLILNSDSEGQNQYSFLNDEFSDSENYDIMFQGIEDKNQELIYPRLYSAEKPGKIIIKDQESCFDLANNKENSDEDVSFVDIEINKEYCLITKSGGNQIYLRVLNLAEDWSSITIEWETLSTEIVETKEEFNFNWQILTYILFIILNIVIIYFIVVITKKILQQAKRKDMPKNRGEDLCKNQENELPMAYCMHCKGKVWIEDPEEDLLENGTEVVKGHCPYCHHKIISIVGKNEDKRKKGYCVKCKKKTPIDNAKKVKLKNGRKALHGKCHYCHTEMYSIISNKKRKIKYDNKKLKIKKRLKTKQKNKDKKLPARIKNRKKLENKIKINNNRKTKNKKELQKKTVKKVVKKTVKKNVQHKQVQHKLSKKVKKEVKKFTPKKVKSSHHKDVKARKIVKSVNKKEKKVQKPVKRIVKKKSVRKTAKRNAVNKKVVIRKKKNIDKIKDKNKKNKETKKPSKEKKSSKKTSLKLKKKRKRKERKEKNSKKNITPIKRNKRNISFKIFGTKYEIKS